MYLFIPTEKIEILKMYLSQYKQEYKVEDKDIPLTPVLKHKSSGLKMQTGESIPLAIEAIGFTLEVKKLPQKYLEIIEKEKIISFENPAEYLQFIENKVS
jgi:hypothetical protein